MRKTSALDGITVLDFGQYIAGPLSAMLLADFGADVIRIDPPGGPRFKSPANAIWNRGKRSIVLDLKSTGDLAIARGLVDKADLVIENFRPGVMERLGLGWDTCRARNHKLIYLSLPGFRHDDPRAGIQAWEGIVAAAAACYSTLRKLGMDRPVFNGVPFSSIFAAHLGAVSAVAALVERQRSGMGQFIEVPLFGATFSAFSGKATKVQGQQELAPRTSWRFVQCGDRKWFMYVPRDLHQYLLEDFNYSGPVVEANSSELLKHVDSVFLTKSAAEWEEYCAKKGVEGASCNTHLEWINHPLAIESGAIQRSVDPVFGEFKGLGSHVRLSRTPSNVSLPQHLLDSDRDDILAMANQPRSLIAGSINRPTDPPLKGIKVLDLGIILAIPSCGRTLAELGAEVIKIDSPYRNPISWHNDINRGKKSILLDMKQEAGKALFYRLLKDVDIVIENFRSGVAEKLGIGYEDLQKARPDIVYGSVNAFGEISAFEKRPGREGLIQAMTGMAVNYGGSVPAQNNFNATDYLTGLGATLGILLALFHRNKTGEGQYVRTALIYGASMLQCTYLHDLPGAPLDDQKGLDSLGRGPLYRAYQTGTGWIFVATTTDKLSSCQALAGLEHLPERDLEGALEKRFRTKTSEDWLRELSMVSIAAQPIFLRFDSLMNDPEVVRQKISLTRQHERQGIITTTGPVIQMSRTPLSPGCCTPMPGADAHYILASIGASTQLPELVDTGIVRVSGVEPGGPS